MTSPTIIVRRTHTIAEIVLNRPDKLNAMNLDWVRDLATVVDELSDPQPRVVVISGNGRAFCSGLDLDMMTQQSMPPDFFPYRRKRSPRWRTCQPSS